MIFRSMAAAAFAILCVLTAESLAAQENIEAQAVPKPTRSTQTERIEVTGSRLKRIDVEGAIPVKTLDAKDFERAGVNTLSDIFRNQSENTFGNFNGNSSDISAGQATINLRGLGSGRTLILVNGRRLPAEASLGGTNVNNIPVAMVERVEILKMSASAVYGADAVAGVVNVILKKNFTGSEFSARASFTQDGGGESRRADAVTGIQLGSTGLTFALGASQEQPIYSRDRDQLWKYKGTYGYSAFANPEGTYSWGLVNPQKRTDDNGLYVFHPSLNCPVENQIAYPKEPDNVMCRGSRRAASTGQSRNESNAWFVTTNADSDWGNGLSSSATVLISDRQTASNPVDRFDTTDPLTSSEYRILLRDAPEDIRKQALALGLPTNDSTQIKVTSGTLAPSIKGNTRTRDQARGGIFSLVGELRGDWEWHTDLSGFQTERRRYYNNVDDKLSLRTFVFPNGNESPQYNLFAPDPTLAEDFFANLYGKERNGIYGATTYLNGDLTPLPGGMATIAFGLNHQRETYELNADPKDKEFVDGKPRFWGSMNADGNGKREINSAFFETNLPVVEKVEVGLAGRFDQYSDFGSTFNYSANFTYLPLTGLKFRGGYGTSFKAPDLSQLFNSSDGGYLSVRDKKYCDASLGKDNPCGENGDSYSTYVNRPGNPDLKEETAQAYNVGFVVEPTTWFSATTDYWNILITGIQSTESLRELIEREIRGESIGNSQISRVDDKTADNFGRIARIDSTYYNLGEQKSQGIDLTTSFHQPVAGVRVALDTTYSRVLSRKDKDTNDSPLEESVGSYGVPRYRMNNRISAEGSAHSVSFDALTTGRTESSEFRSDPDYGYIAAWTRYDATYSWNHPWDGTVSIGVYNIANRIGSLHETDRERGIVDYDRSLSDIAGRSYFVTAKQRF